MNKLLAIVITLISIVIFLFGLAILVTAFNKLPNVFHTYPLEMIIALRLIIGFICLSVGIVIFYKGFYKLIKKK